VRNQEVFCLMTGGPSQSLDAGVLSHDGFHVTRMTVPPFQPGSGPAALCGALVITLAIVGCAETYPAYPQMPAPLAERVPEPPHSSEALSWRPRYWDWSADITRVPGQWVPLAGHRAMWQDGYRIPTQLSMDAAGMEMSSSRETDTDHPALPAQCTSLLLEELTRVLT
jgi:hypothetical protein